MHPGNRYARHPGAGRTLGELVAAKIALVAVCRRCKHRRVLYPARLVARCAENFPAIELRERLRCTACRYGSANLHESSR
jgi:DNA-directed RNA polymerase subunit RPC12/RpoP